MQTAEVLRKLTIPKLKDILRGQGKNVGGRKEELVQRILGLEETSTSIVLSPYLPPSTLPVTPHHSIYSVVSNSVVSNSVASNSVVLNSVAMSSATLEPVAATSSGTTCTLSSFNLQAISCKRPRFPKGQKVLESADRCSVLNLDEENAVVVINCAIVDPEYRQGYLEDALMVSRSSPYLFGAPIPRAQVCYTTTGAAYKYSGRKHGTIVFPDHVLDMISRLMEVFNQVVPDNQYRTVDTATDLIYSAEQERGGSISPHKDDENPNWGLVLVYTVGQERWLRVRKNHNGELGDYVNVKLTDNSIVAMYGPTFQSKYTHHVDKLKVGEPIGARHSLNVRFVSSPELLSKGL